MSRPRKLLCVVAALLFIGFTAGIPVRAQDKPKEGWSDVAEFSYVATAGNSQVKTLGLKNLLKRTWERDSFELKAGAVRSESTTKTWTVLSTGEIDEQSTTTLAAENYYLNGRYDRKITDKFFWFGGAGWERNRPAGVDSRTWGSGGVGNIWADTDTNKFRTDYSLTYTKQKDVVQAPDFEDTFMGARFSWNYLQKFGAVTTYGNDFIIDENLNDTSDFRGDMTNWVAVAMSQRLALKVSLQFLYDHVPAYAEANDPGPPPDGYTPGPDLVQLDSLDSIFMVSLVVKF